MREQSTSARHLPVHYVVWRSLPGGAELSVRHYVEGYGAKRRLYLYSLRDSDNAVCTDPRLHFDKGADGGWACYKRYFRYCRAHRQDIFHLMSTGPIILLLTLLAGVRTPLYHIHGTIYWKKKLDRVYLRIAWWLAGLFRIHFVANSEYSAGIFDRKVMPVHPRVIYNGFDVERFWAHRSKRTRLRRIAYIGRLQPGKNTELVLSLFEAIADKYPELELHLAGDGALRPTLEATAAKSVHRDRIV
ncbi:MAG: hypothetical protein EP344_13975, partial [Bacteroidetes bacterium]